MDDRISELESRLDEAADDSVRSEVLAELAWTVKYPDPSRAVELGRKAAELAESSGNTLSLPKACLAMAMGHLHMSNFQEAENAGLRGLDQYQRNENYPGIRHALNVMGSIYNHWGKSDKALDSYLEAQRIDSELSQTPDPGILSNLGAVYMKLGDYDRALDIFLRVLEISEGMAGPPDLKAAASLNLGEAYHAVDMQDEAMFHYVNGLQVCRDSDMKGYIASAAINIGILKLEQGSADDALEHFEEALALFRTLRDRQGTADVLANMGRARLDAGSCESALNLFSESLGIYGDLDNAPGMAEALTGVSRSLAGMGRTDEAREKISQARQIASDEGLKPMMVDILETMSDLSEAAGRPDEALEHYRERHRLDRELHSEKFEQKLLNLKIAHEVERSRREAEIYRLKNLELSRHSERLEEMILHRTRELQSEKKERKISSEVREQLEMELGRDRRLAILGELAGGAAHDFNNVLTVIAANADLATEESSLSETARKRLENILEAVERGSSLSRQLTAFSRKVPLRDETVFLNELVRSTTAMLERTMGDGVTIECALDQNNPALLGDRLQIENVLVNLMLNARDAMDAEGVIKVRTGRLSEGNTGVPAGVFDEGTPLLLLEVMDEGCGISSADLERVFDPFYTTKREAGGTGLGLSVVHGIVTRHRGWISVESKPGQGSRFTVYFPETSSAVHFGVEEKN